MATAIDHLQAPLPDRRSWVSSAEGRDSVLDYYAFEVPSSRGPTPINGSSAGSAWNNHYTTDDPSPIDDHGRQEYDDAVAVPPVPQTKGLQSKRNNDIGSKRWTTVFGGKENQPGAGAAAASAKQLALARSISLSRIPVHREAARKELVADGAGALNAQMTTSLMTSADKLDQQQQQQREAEREWELVQQKQRRQQHRHSSQPVRESIKMHAVYASPQSSSSTTRIMQDGSSPSFRQPPSSSGSMTRSVSMPRALASRRMMRDLSGPPPWLNKFEPDPRLPADQQLPPTVARRIALEAYVQETGSPEGFDEIWLAHIPQDNARHSFLQLDNEEESASEPVDALTDDSHDVRHSAYAASVYEPAAPLSREELAPPVEPASRGTDRGLAHAEGSSMMDEEEDEQVMPLSLIPSRAPTRQQSSHSIRNFSRRSQQLPSSTSLGTLAAAIEHEHEPSTAAGVVDETNIATGVSDTVGPLQHSTAESGGVVQRSRQSSPQTGRRTLERTLSNADAVHAHAYATGYLQHGEAMLAAHPRNSKPAYISQATKRLHQDYRRSQLQSATSSADEASRKYQARRATGRGAADEPTAGCRCVVM